RVCCWVAPKNAVFQNTGEGPCYTCIGGVTPTALPKVGQHAVKLPPPDCHFAGVCRVNRDRTFVSCVTDDVIPICIDVNLVTDENAIRRDHSRRTLQPIDISWRIVVFFQWPGGTRVPRGGLPKSRCNRGDGRYKDQSG